MDDMKSTFNKLTYDEKINVLKELTEIREEPVLYKRLDRAIKLGQPVKGFMVVGTVLYISKKTNGGKKYIIITDESSETHLVWLPSHLHPKLEVVNLDEEYPPVVAIIGAYAEPQNNGNERFKSLSNKQHFYKVYDYGRVEFFDEESLYLPPRRNDSDQLPLRRNLVCKVDTCYFYDRGMTDDIYTHNNVCDIFGTVASVSAKNGNTILALKNEDGKVIEVTCYFKFFMKKNEFVAIRNATNLNGVINVFYFFQLINGFRLPYKLLNSYTTKQMRLAATKARIPPDPKPSFSLPPAAAADIMPPAVSEGSGSNRKKKGRVRGPPIGSSTSDSQWGEQELEELRMNELEAREKILRERERGREKGQEKIEREQRRKQQEFDEEEEQRRKEWEWERARARERAKEYEREHSRPELHTANDPRRSSRDNNGRYSRQTMEVPNYYKQSQSASSPPPPPPPPPKSNRPVDPRTHVRRARSRSRSRSPDSSPSQHNHYSNHPIKKRVTFQPGSETDSPISESSVQSDKFGMKSNEVRIKKEPLDFQIPTEENAQNVIHQLLQRQPSPPPKIKEEPKSPSALDALRSLPRVSNPDHFSSAQQLVNINNTQPQPQPGSSQIVAGDGQVPITEPMFKSDDDDDIEAPVDRASGDVKNAVIYRASLCRLCRLGYVFDNTCNYCHDDTGNSVSEIFVQMQLQSDDLPIDCDGDLFVIETIASGSIFGITDDELEKKNDVQLSELKLKIIGKTAVFDTNDYRVIAGRVKVLNVKVDC